MRRYDKEQYSGSTSQFTKPFPEAGSFDSYNHTMQGAQQADQPHFREETVALRDGYVAGSIFSSQSSWLQSQCSFHQPRS